MGGWSSAAADVTQAASQEAIKDSLLSDSTRELGPVSQLFERTEAAHTADSNGFFPDDYLPGGVAESFYQPGRPEPQEAEAEQEQIAEGDWSPDPTAEEMLDNLRTDLRNQTALELAEQQAQQAPVTTADDVIEKYELTGNPEEQQEAAEGFAEIFGGDIEQFNAPAFEQLTARTGVDIALYYKEAGGNPERARPLSAEDLSTIGGNFRAGLLATFNIDPRAANSSPEGDMYIGDWAINKAWNIIDSYTKNGYVIDMAKVNSSRQAAVQGFGEFLELCGKSSEEINAIFAANPQLPIQAADWFGKFVLAPVHKLTAGQQSQQRATPQHRASQPGRTRRTSSQRFQTNEEIFGDPAVLHRIAMEHL